MAVISHEHRFLFIQSPRTGCTALGFNLLVTEYGGEKLPPEPILDRRGRPAISNKHATVDELVRHGLVGSDELPSLFVFTTVRNPFDSLVSGYLKRRGPLHELKDTPRGHWIHERAGGVDELRFCQEHSFPEWVEWKLTRRRARGLLPRRPVHPRHMHARWMRDADHVMRFESLQADFDDVCDRLGMAHHEIPQVNVTANRESRSYREYYDEDARRLVEHVFQPDIERFGYAF